MSTDSINAQQPTMHSNKRSQTSRRDIFNNIRRGLKADSVDTQRQQRVTNRLSAKADNLIPARSQLPVAEQVALFKTMAIEAAAELIELDNIEQLPQACCDWLTQHQCKQLISASTPVLRDLDWEPLTQQQINRTERVAQAGDIASLTTSFAGIAETGTLMLHSNAHSPTTLNFLPDNHLVVLHRSAIVGSYEEAWKKLRQQCFGDNPDQQLPRTVNMITGPSRSADIEQTLQMGAHGPKALIIFLIND
ncbi:lactate utilization protein [Amphritea sp. 1_MG-2023]|uniref:LutC/YkgG family protein n=1 Tax=Amphritea sp. 1_MG-2023 TaxID=3062670 RepID=UPI0026E3A9C2|nr:lactate utilization protein [Amphritea sp. 1_MG-2023]MDO6564148.1 lactate utilization protein [Amphritea sp. 1_MG-2023]